VAGCAKKTSGSIYNRLGGTGSTGTYFNTACYTQPSYFAYGNESRTDNTLRTPGDFAVTLGLSLAMWALISLSYLEIARAFVASPQLAGLTLAKCMLLMASSMAVSGFQLPVLGWFTQIGAVAAAMSGFFGVAAEPATACAATLLAVTFLGIAPVGLIWARFEHVSLRKVTAESEHAEEELAADEPVG